jgi:hypothetical protein
VRLRIEAGRVRRQVGAEVAERPRIDVVELVEIPVVLRVLADDAEDARQEALVDRLDDGIEARVLIVDVEPRVRLTRRRHADAREQPHRHRFTNARWILCQIVEHDRLQPEEGLGGGIAIEVDAQAGLRAAA